MIVTLTSFNGNVKKINLPNANAVKTFLVELPQNTPMHTRLNFNCDVLGFQGFITGTKLDKQAKGRDPPSVLTIYFGFIFLNHVSYISTKYSDFMKIEIFSDFQGIRYN